MGRSNEKIFLLLYGPMGKFERVRGKMGR